MTGKHALISSLLICLFAGQLVAQQKNHSPTYAKAQNSSSTIIAGELGAKLDEYLTRLSGFGYSGAVLVMKDGKTVLRKGYGLANQKASIANTPDTVFDIGSLTKQFTAAAILQLEDAGNLKVSDPIQKFLPAAPADKANITIHQLLTHTAGTPNSMGDKYIEITREEVLRRIFTRKLKFEPGSRFEYSNSGYELLAAIVEVASGKSYRDYLRKHLFEPAGLHSTGFWGKAVPAVSPSLLARAHDELGEIGNLLTWSETTWYGVGSGGVTSTVNDLYKWYLALQGETILSRSAKEKMFTPVMPEATPSFKYYTSDYGYGWWVQKTPRGTTRIQHGGDSIGFGTQFTWYKDENILLIVACNIRHDWYPTIIKASRVIPNIIFGEKYDAPPAFRASDPKLIKKVAGTYQLPSGGKFVVRMNNHHLEIGAEGQDATDILRECDEKELKQRAELSAKAIAVFEGTTKADFTAMAAALPSGEDIKFYRDGWPDEMRELSKDKGSFQRIESMGTFPSGNPNLLLTVLRFVFEKGSSPYKVMWKEGQYWGSETVSPPLSALTPIQAESKTSFVGWNIMTWKKTSPFHISLIMKSDQVTGFTIKRDGQEWLARKVASPNKKTT